MLLDLLDPDPLVRGTDLDRLLILPFYEIMPENRFLTQNFSKNLIFKTENNVPGGKLLEKNMENF